MPSAGGLGLHDDRLGSGDGRRSEDGLWRVGRAGRVDASDSGSWLGGEIGGGRPFVDCGDAGIFLRWCG